MSQSVGSILSAATVVCMCIGEHLTKRGTGCGNGGFVLSMHYSKVLLTLKRDEISVNQHYRLSATDLSVFMLQCNVYTH